MLRFKIAPPHLPRLVDRPRLLRTVLPTPVVVLAAPAGHGKTCLAAQVAAATGGPTAWFIADELDRDRSGVVATLLGALEAAWNELEGTVPPVLDDDAAVPLLGAALETLAGPGCVVMDDVHLLPGDVLDAIARTAIAALPPDCHLVLCTRADVPEAVLRAEAMGRAVTLGPADLVFDVDECGWVSPSAESGVEVHARTGGWPLAVALSAHRDVGSVSALGELALADLGREARELLVVLARLPRFPTRLLTRLGDRYAHLESFGRRHAVLFSYDDGWWFPREWLREALQALRADGSLVEAVARALRDLDEAELAAHLLVAETRYEDAVPLIERLVSDGMAQGRAAWVRALIAPVPPSARTFALDLLAASAANSLSIVDPTTNDAVTKPELLDLVDRAAGEGTGALLRARSLLANHYRMMADVQLLALCEQALGDALTVDAPEQQLVDRWSPEDAPAAAEMLRFYGSALLLSGDRGSIERGRRLVAAALDLLDGAGRPTLSLRAWSTYVEVLLFLTNAFDAVRTVRPAAHRMVQLDHHDAAVRLAELATIEFFAGDHVAARRTTELARECADRTGNRIALPPLAAIEVALDVVDTAFTPEHGRRFDDTVVQLAANPRLAPFTALIAAEFGIVLVRQGQMDVARRYLDDAEKALGTTLVTHTTSLRCRRLRGLLLLADGSAHEGRAVLDAIRREAAAEGRVALVTLIETDLAEQHRPPATAQRRRPVPSPVVVQVMAPELALSVDGEAVPTPRGYPAKLLVLLVVSNGLMTLDAAIERLWPGADPDIGRNRLHGVLLRLRRTMGLPAGGPISCTEGLVRLHQSPQVQIDSWEFEHLAARADSRPDARAEAIAAYRGDVLSAQFAYDDTVAAYRRNLRRTFLRHATALLTDPPEAFEAGALASLARRAYRLAPDDDNVCRVAARTLTCLGHHAEAGELLDGTARTLVELGSARNDSARP